MVINNIINQIENGEPPLKITISVHDRNEIDAFVIANPIEIGENAFLEIFVIPVNLMSGSRR